jgi:hypothetical protein
MVVGIKRVVGLAVGAVSLLFISTAAIAQEVTSETEGQEEFGTVQEAFIDAFYTRGQTFYRNRQIPRAFTWFLGPFPENDIIADGRAVNRVYRSALIQQAELDPLIRTADLPNPFDTSLLLLPAEVQPLPPARPAPLPVFPEPAPVPAPIVEPVPVPGLY